MSRTERATGRAWGVRRGIAAAALVAMGGCEVGSDLAGETFFINPGSVTLYKSVQSLRLEAIGGQGPYRWSVSDESAGTIAPWASVPTNAAGGAFGLSVLGASALPGQGARVVTYVRKASAAVNVITVEDQNYWTATAVITQTDGTDGGKLRIAPKRATLNAETDSFTITVLGGSPPYSWAVDPSRLGYLSDYTDDQCTYHRQQGRPGTVRVRVTDTKGTEVVATVVQEADPSSIKVTASPSTLAEDGDDAILTVSGGAPPYTWSVFDVTRGDILGSNEGVSVVYRRNDRGDAVVRVTDDLGVTVDTMIAQP